MAGPLAGCAAPAGFSSRLASRERIFATLASFAKSEVPASAGGKSPSTGVHTASNAPWPKRLADQSVVARHRGSHN